MSSLCERRALLVLLTKACGAGARLAPACAQIGLSERTVQRWQRPPASDDGDLRASSQRVATPPPPNRLSGTERRAAMALLNSDEFKDLPPSQIVPRLADQGRFVASESTLYRLLRSAGQLKHRCGERAPHKRSRPRALAATGPHQIYSWDITYLPTDVRGVYFYFYFYFYVFVDLFSRKLVGWQVYDCESANRAGELLTDIGARQRIAPQQLTLHSDNGSPMLATLQRLGVAGSRSRPSVSNDNPFSEALFRTLKLYRPPLPVKPLQSLLHARRWAIQLVHWYNHEHRRSALGFVTPPQRHVQIDRSLLSNRVRVYTAARNQHPSR